LQSKDYSTSIEDSFASLLGIKVWPNPFRTALNIDAPLCSPINIYDLSGSLIARLEHNKEYKTWTPDIIMAPGIYIIAPASSKVVQKVVFLGR
jgi:hypothetical protein